MRYTAKRGLHQNRGKRWLFLVISFALLGAGIYLLLNTLSPVLPSIGVDQQATATKLKTTAPEVSDNRLYMPQVNVDVPIVEIQSGESEESALDRGAIHRKPQNGNPKDGGNFVLAAHRFTLGLTPADTRAKSPFYHIDQMKVGDEVYVDYKGTRYAYKVFKAENVAPSAVDIEDRTSSPQLTIYSCTLGGANDGRIVLFAELVGTVIWENGTPKLQTISN